MSDIKCFFNEWCAKARKEASYESRPTGNYRFPWFVCTLILTHSMVCRSQASDQISL